MIAPRPAIIACAALALALAWRRPSLRPVAAALTSLAAIDGTRFPSLPALWDVALWCLWPGVWSSLAWRVWRQKFDGAVAIADDRPTSGLAYSRGPPAHNYRTLFGTLAQPWVYITLAFLVYAAVVPLVPWSWAAHPWAWSVALVVPHWAGVAVGFVAWATGQRASGDELVAQRVAATLTFSGMIDILVGALTPSGTWSLATAVSWATWVGVGYLLVRGSYGKAGQPVAR